MNFIDISFQVFTKDIPYKGMAPLMIASEVAYKNRRPLIPDYIPSRVSLLITECWDESPSLRPDFHEILDRLTEIQLLYEDEIPPPKNIELIEFASDKYEEQ